MKPLPILMVAPNGARKTQQDHPALPLSISETVDVAKRCFAVGADAIHLHVRDRTGAHSLDANLYKEAIDKLQAAVPDMAIQITTEAVGKYSPALQRDVVRRVRPDFVSVSLAEMLAEQNRSAAIEFYHWCSQESIAVQHILYGQEDLNTLGSMLEEGHLSRDDLQLLFVLGRYTRNQESTPDDLLPFVSWLSNNEVEADWALCAFGRNETACLQAGLESGGKIRVGFENSFWNADGTIAKDNAERVESMKRIIEVQN